MWRGSPAEAPTLPAAIARVLLAEAAPAVASDAMFALAGGGSDTKSRSRLTRLRYHAGNKVLGLIFLEPRIATDEYRGNGPIAPMPGGLVANQSPDLRHDSPQEIMQVLRSSYSHSPSGGTSCEYCPKGGPHNNNTAYAKERENAQKTEQ